MKINSFFLGALSISFSFIYGMETVHEVEMPEDIKKCYDFAQRLEDNKEKEAYLSLINYHDHNNEKMWQHTRSQEFKKFRAKGYPFTDAIIYECFQWKPIKVKTVDGHEFLESVAKLKDYFTTRKLYEPERAYSDVILPEHFTGKLVSKLLYPCYFVRSKNINLWNKEEILEDITQLIDLAKFLNMQDKLDSLLSELRSAFSQNSVIIPLENAKNVFHDLVGDGEFVFMQWNYCSNVQVRTKQKELLLSLDSDYYLQDLNYSGEGKELVNKKTGQEVTKMEVLQIIADKILEHHFPSDIEEIKTKALQQVFFDEFYQQNDQRDVIKS